MLLLLEILGASLHRIRPSMQTLRTCCEAREVGTRFVCVLRHQKAEGCVVEGNGSEQVRQDARNRRRRATAGEAGCQMH